MIRIIQKILSNNLIYALYRRYLSVAELFINYNYPKAQNPTLDLDSIRNYNRNRLKGPKKIICNAPFNHIYFNNQGVLSACCMTKNDAYGSINDGTIASNWQSEKAKQFRDKIKNYNLEKGCAGCKRAIEVGNYNSVLAKMYDSFLPVKTDTEYPTEMTFELTNLCNLECTMCQGEYSSLIRKNREGLPEISNPYSASFFDELTVYLPHLKVARFLGGEPFLINEYYKIWEFLMVHNPNCKIIIQSNGTVLNNKVKTLLQSKNLDISFSLDSLQKLRYESIRKNAGFDRILENINYFISWSEKNNKYININFCLLENNWDEIPDIIDFCTKHNCSLNIIPVEFPLYSSLRCLSAQKLSGILSYLRGNEMRISKNYTRMFQVFSETVNYVEHVLEEAVKTEQQIQKAEQYPSGKLTEVLIAKLSDALSASETKEISDITETLNVDELSKRKILSRFIVELDYIGTGNEFYLHEKDIRSKKVKERLIEIQSHLSDKDFI